MAYELIFPVCQKCAMDALQNLDRTGLRFDAPLPDLWDDEYAASLDEPGLLLYRSNLLGSDLRITNFGGGNTSAKLAATDPLTGALNRRQMETYLGEALERRARCAPWRGHSSL